MLKGTSLPMTTNLKTQDNPGDECNLPSRRVVDNRSLVASIGRTISASYDPQPIARPAVNPQLPLMTAIPRITEVCRYSLAKLEYSLSSGGGLRAWFKLNLLLALMIAIPALLVMPAITLVLGTFATWTDFLAMAATNIFWATLAIIATSALITGGLFAIRMLTSRRC